MAPTKPKYIPNQRPPPQVHSSRPNDAARQNERPRKVVISRFLLVDGNITFAVGTEIDGVITRDAQEVPVAKILDHVSPAELERFENQDFFDEDERERLLPPKKPRGRPRKGDKLLPSFSVAPIGKETSREQSLLPEGSIPKKKRVGRPKGTFRKKAVNEPSAGIRKPRGRPPRQRNLSVVVPAFNGPQPQNVESTPDTQSESDEVLDNPKPQYSMITASGLGQSDTEDQTSRDQSVELGPSSKRRRLDAGNAFVDPSLDDNNAGRSSSQNHGTELFSDMSPDPIANDSTALLRQFQARVYGPNHSEKSHNIPHRQSKSSLTFDDSHFYTPRSSLGSLSSDSLMGHNPRHLTSLPKETTPSNPPQEKVPSQVPQGNISTKVSTSFFENSTIMSHSPHHQPANTPPKKSTSPVKSVRRKFSFTPHFPPSASFSHSRSIKRSAERRPKPSLPPTSRHIPPQPPPQPTRSTLLQSSSTQVPLPKRRKLSPETQRAPSQSSQSQTSSTTRLGFAGLPRAKSITDYFAPKAPAPIPSPPLKPRHSPSSQLLGSAAAADSTRDSDSDSEDQLAREPSSSDSDTESDSDSLNSEILIIHRNDPTTRPTVTEPKPQNFSSSTHTHSDPHDSETQSSDSDSENNDAPSHISNTAASPIRQPTTNPITTTKQHLTTASLDTAFDLDDDDEDDDDGETESDSDSRNSEVMIIRSS